MPTISPPALALTDVPSQHPDSCLSLSLRLIDNFSSLIPVSNATVLSIGSGTGLLEALLINASKSPFPNDHTITVHGIEPQPGAANKYLPEDHLHLVPGTWAMLSPAKALQYGMWLFVYPREKALVRRYLDILSPTSSTSEKQVLDPMVVVWAGPRVDWEEEGFELEFRGGCLKFRACFTGSDGGIAEWEAIYVFDWDDGAGGQSESESKVVTSMQGTTSASSIDKL